MEIWLIVGGKRSGPYPDYEIRSRIEHGQVDEDEKVWHEGLAEWTRLGDLDLFRHSFQKTEESEEQIVSSEILLQKPVPIKKQKTYFMRRFWARWMDISAYVCLVWLAMYVSGRDIAAANANPWFLPAILLPWIPIEAWCIKKFGATPGKWLLGLRVTREDQALMTFIQAISRSFRVMATGIGFCWGILPILCQALSLVLTLTMGRPLWDHFGKHQIIASRPKVFRILAVVLIFFLTLQLQMAVLGPHQVKILKEQTTFFEDFPSWAEALEKNERWYFPIKKATEN